MLFPSKGISRLRARPGPSALDLTAFEKAGETFNDALLCACVSLCPHRMVLCHFLIQDEYYILNPVEFCHTYGCSKIERYIWVVRWCIDTIYRNKALLCLRWHLISYFSRTSLISRIHLASAWSNRSRKTQNGNKIITNPDSVFRLFLFPPLSWTHPYLFTEDIGKIAVRTETQTLADFLKIRLSGVHEKLCSLQPLFADIFLWRQDHLIFETNSPNTG